MPIIKIPIKIDFKLLKLTHFKSKKDFDLFTIDLFTIWDVWYIRHILYKFSTTILYILYDKREIGIIFQEECLRGCVCLKKFIAVLFLFIILLVGVYFFVSPVRNVEKLDHTASLSSLAQEKSDHATSLELNGGSPVLGYRVK